MSASRIRVLVRPRPLRPELNERMAAGVSVSPSNRRFAVGPKTYEPDILVSQTATQRDVFSHCTPVLESVCDGCNGTIMVYGQTGTGKTYTMIGENDPEGGIAGRSIQHLLQHVSRLNRASLERSSAMSSARSSAGNVNGNELGDVSVVTAACAALSLSILEIYNERISDMLDMDPTPSTATLSSANKLPPEVKLYGGVPQNIKGVIITSTDEAIKLIEKALIARHTNSTAMNERSSRSHVLLLLDLQVERPPSSPIAEETEHVTIAKLVLVDLAGSESVKKSLAIGKIAAEAGKINRSLLALKNVIRALASPAAQSQQGSLNAALRTVTSIASDTRLVSSVHVPYRESKLTELLQDSIGGSARTMLIACVSLNDRDIEESKSTLDYATKARLIRNCGTSEREKLLGRNRALEAELQRLHLKLNDQVAERGVYQLGKTEYEKYKTINEDLKEAKKHLKTLHEICAQQQACKNIADSRVAALREIILEKTEDVNAAKTALARGLDEFEQSTRQLEHTASTSLDQLAQHFGVQNSQGMANVHIALENGLNVPSELVQQPLESLNELWKSLQTQHSQALCRLAEHTSQLATQMQQALEQQQQETEGAWETFARALQASRNQSQSSTERIKAEVQAKCEAAQSVSTALIASIQDTTTTEAIKQKTTNAIDDVLHQVSHHVRDKVGTALTSAELSSSNFWKDSAERKLALSSDALQLLPINRVAEITCVTAEDLAAAVITEKEIHKPDMENIVETLREDEFISQETSKVVSAGHSTAPLSRLAVLKKQQLSQRRPNARSVEARSSIPTRKRPRSVSSRRFGP